MLSVRTWFGVMWERVHPASYLSSWFSSQLAAMRKQVHSKGITRAPTARCEVSYEQIVSKAVHLGNTQALLSLPRSLPGFWLCSLRVRLSSGIAEAGAHGKMFNRENLVESRFPWEERFLCVANPECNSFRPILSPHSFILVLKKGGRFLRHQVCHVTMRSASLPTTTSWFHISVPHQRPERCTDQLPFCRHLQTRLNWCEQEGVHGGPSKRAWKHLRPVHLRFRGNP